MKQRLVVFALALVVLAPRTGHAATDDLPCMPLLAGPFGHGTGMMIAGLLATDLDLGSEQRAALQQLRDDFENALAPLLALERERMQEVRALLESDDPDPYEVGTLTIEAHEGRLQIEALHAALREKIRSLLDAEQLERWRELESRRAERRPLVRDGFSFRPD